MPGRRRAHVYPGAPGEVMRGFCNVSYAREWPHNPGENSDVPEKIAESSLISFASRDKNVGLGRLCGLIIKKMRAGFLTKEVRLATLHRPEKPYRGGSACPT
jgi:hypothetical protein